MSISYNLPRETRVSLKVYNLSGQWVRTLVSGISRPGHWQVTWDGRSENGTPVPPGAYLYRLDAGSYSATGKLVFLQ